MFDVDGIPDMHMEYCWSHTDTLASCLAFRSFLSVFAVFSAVLLLGCLEKGTALRYARGS